MVFESPLKRIRTDQQVSGKESMQMTSSLDQKAAEDQVSPSVRDYSETFPQHLEASLRFKSRFSLIDLIVTHLSLCAQ